MISLGVNQGFPRKVRIVKTDDFSSVFSLRKRIHGQYLVLHYQVHNHESVLANQASVRFAVVAAKKVSKLSVERNYMKRVMRELFRQQRPQLEAQLPLGLGLDMIVRTQKTFTKQKFLAVKEEYLNLLQRILKRLNQTALNTEASK